MLFAKEISIGSKKSIIGSGLIAKAFLAADLPSCVCVYAAGVSNSSCSDITEFQRERLRLTAALKAHHHADHFIYFSTCSIVDPAAQYSSYVQHKIEMEALVSEHSNFIIVRLPQIAGNTPNPHTLLNYLYAKISRGEKFSIWKNAIRNIIDIDDVTLIVTQIIKHQSYRTSVINVANPISLPIATIVAIMEQELGKSAVADIIDKYSSYEINTKPINEIIARLGLKFDDNYMVRVIKKYYGQGHQA